MRRPIGYVLRDVRALATPVPCKGKLGFWTLDAEVERRGEGEDRVRAQLAIHWPTANELWSIAPREDSLAAELADGHYSRQTPGADGFLAPGACLVLYHRGPLGAATWGVVHNVFREVWRWRNAIFANRSGTLSSVLIAAATLVTYQEWRRIYGTLPAQPLRTEVDIAATRRRRSKRHEAGHCYIMAGWRKVRDVPAGHGARPRSSSRRRDDRHQPQRELHRRLPFASRASLDRLRPRLRRAREAAQRTLPMGVP